MNEVAHFVISGEFVTQHVRNRVLDGCWEDALTFLTKNMGGMTTDIALDILNGTSKIGGATDEPKGVYLDEDDPTQGKTKEYLDSLAFQTAGALRDNKGYWWVPYAAVTGFCREDAKFASETYGMAAGQYAGVSLMWAEERVRFYADDRRRDRISEVDLLDCDFPTSKVSILWKTVNGIPFWIDSCKTETESVMQRIEVRGIENRGAHQILDPDAPKTGLLDEPIKPTPRTDPEEHEPDPPPYHTKDQNEINKFRSGWLSPDGDFYPCSYMAHISTANNIMEHRLNEEGTGGEPKLEKLGWCKLTATGTWLASLDKRPTSRQKNVVQIWCVENDTKMPTFFGDDE